MVPKASLMPAAAGAAFGYLLPSMALGRMAQRRQHRIRSRCPTRSTCWW
jgi:hypothetical protein